MPDPARLETFVPNPTRRETLQYRAVMGRHRARAAWHLRAANRVGRLPEVYGRPLVEATDLEVGDNFKILSKHRRTMVSGWGRIRMGDRVFLNSGTIVFSVVSVTIGDDVALANDVYVTDTNSHGLEGRDPVEAPVVIGDGSWIGARSLVLPGVTIGQRVVVAAGSVVTADIADDTLVGGNPARVIRPLVYPQGCDRAWHDHLCACPGRRSLLVPPPGSDRSRCSAPGRSARSSSAGGTAASSRASSRPASR